jgi:putative ABC transport system permease protein
MGLRIAVGADPSDVVRMVVRDGMALALIGVVPGLALSVVAAFLMRTVLLGLRPLVPVAFLGATGLLILPVVAASLAPALRAE